MDLTSFATVGAHQRLTVAVNSDIAASPGFRALQEYAQHSLISPALEQAAARALNSPAMQEVSRRMMAPLAPWIQRSVLANTRRMFETVIEQRRARGAAWSIWLGDFWGTPTSIVGGQAFQAHLDAVREYIRWQQGQSKAQAAIRMWLIRLIQISDRPGHRVTERPHVARGPNRRLILINQPAGTTMRA